MGSEELASHWMYTVPASPTVKSLKAFRGVQKTVAKASAKARFLAESTLKEIVCNILSLCRVAIIKAKKKAGNLFTDLQPTKS